MRVFVGIVGHDRVPPGLVPPPVARRALDTILVEQAHVEPDRGVEGPVLVDAEPGQVAVEILAILTGLEVTVGNAPIGDRAGHAMDQLPDRVLPLRSVDLAVEVLAHDDVCGQLTPGSRNLTGRLLEEHLAVFPLDRGSPEFPFGGVKRAFDVDRTERRVDFEGGAAGRARVGGRAGGGAARERGRVEICHGIRSPKERGCGQRPTVKSILPYSSRATAGEAESKPSTQAAETTQTGVRGQETRSGKCSSICHAIARCCGGRSADHCPWAGA